LLAQVDHKRTFLYLEQLILRNKVHTNALRIVESKGGLDFFFAQRTHAHSFVDFLSTVMPVRYKTSERLISADTHSNTANFKYTISVEIPPVCKVRARRFLRLDMAVYQPQGRTT
jgi:nonsense-mediated mRNA decay protein 3